jgi:TldD protein
MSGCTRRSFIKRAGVGTAGTALLLPLAESGWLTLGAAEPRGYFESQFGITDGLCGKTLSRALAKGGDFADLYFEHTTSNYLVLEDGKVNQAFSTIELGVGIRTVMGDQVGYGFTQELTQRAMLAAADTAASIASSNAAGCAKQFVKKLQPDNYGVRAGVVSLSLKDKVALVQRVNDQCFAACASASKVTAVMEDSMKRILVVSSDGAKAEDVQPKNFLMASIVAEKNGRREQSGWNFGGRQELSYYTPELADRLARKVADRVMVLFDAVQPPAGELPVVLGPGVTGILLHEAIGHGMEADFNRKQVSTFCTMIGKKVAEPFVTIIDDATNPRLSGSINVDDEGTPGQRTVLVENGILRGYLHDRISARYYKVAPTGNGRRESYQHYPIPRMRNTYMLGGKSSPAGLIGGVSKGIYVADVSNGQVEIGAGDFAFYVSQGRMIESGTLTAPIKDVNIMGNGPKMLANIIDVANDLEMYEGGAGYCGKFQRVPVSFGLPTCLVKSMTVGGVQQKGA